MLQNFSEEQELLQLIFQNIPAGVAVFNSSDLRLIMANPAYRSFIAEPDITDKIEGKHPQEFLPADEKSDIVAIFRKVATTGESYVNNEAIYSWPGKGDAYWQWSVIPLGKDQGKPKYIVVIALDISEQVLQRIKTEEAVVAREEERKFYQRILDNIPVAVTYLDKELIYRQANREASSALGFAVEQILGTHLDTIVGENRIVKDGVRSVINTGKPFNMPSLPYNPLDKPHETHYYIASYLPDFDEQGNVIGVFAEGIDVTSTRKETERILKDWEEKFRLLYTQLPGLIWTVDTKLRFISLYGNNKLIEKLGEKGKKAVGNTLYWLIDTEDPSHTTIAAHLEALQGKSVQFESNFQSIDYSNILEPLKNEKGEIIGVIGVAVDVSERKKLEKELHLQKAYLDLISSQVPAIIMTTDKNLIIQQIYGYNVDAQERDKMIRGRGCSLFDYFKTHKETHPGLAAHLAALEGKVSDYQETSASGLILSTRVKPFRNENCEIIGSISASFNITAQIQLQEELRRQKDAVELINSQLPATIVVMDKDLRFTALYGKGYSARYEETKNEIIGKNIYWYMGNDDPDAEPAATYRQAIQGVAGVTEINIRGTEISIAVSPLYDKNGEIIGAVSVNLDITEKKRLENELIAKNKELENFAFRVSHDLKVPLNILLGYLDQLKEEPEKCIEFSEQIRKQSTSQVDLINSLFRLARAGLIVDVKQEVELDPTVREAFIMAMGMGMDKTVDLIIENDLPVIHGDPERLGFLFYNLFYNSIIYRDPEKEKLIIAVGCKEEDSKLILWVQDNGIGIDPSIIDKIFDYGFTTAPYQRSGFGLTTVRKIVEAHGGRIWAKSEGNGKGATFFISIPQ